MNKIQIVNVIAKKHDISKVQVKFILESILAEIVMSLKLGNTVKLTGFGVFKVKYRHARIGRNPQTGKEIRILASKIPTFVFSKSLKGVMN
ncbi:HU family DNA-binding protein [Blochmannia endosymbiont of Colobopsis nipponica]|uniref:HU family DNA-binding protein n=1 Tax=Blochmannia endosymbiont of Colobopsis nipponica TaxID=2681987 RepID=UPI00177AD0ED|nr:HU family DNA-binding protein [Blochmannia endosymbiont of Colobopsis nipponica]QOI10921.1 HU family DNA-binding protein [Blochmannia endosymbiont of Colobopsis nipponica]